MNGIHDMGGMDGFGKVEPEADEPVFHAPWEGRVIAMMRAMGAAGAWNLDVFRDARERQPPTVYLTSSYYKSWLLSAETLTLERRYVVHEELAAGRAFHPGRPLPRGVLRPKDVPAAVRRGSYERPSPFRRFSKWAIACAQKTCIRRRTRAFPGTPAEGWA